MSKRVKVVQETPSGRNEKFQDGPRVISRPEFVKEIKQGDHPDYHARHIMEQYQSLDGLFCTRRLRAA